MDRGLLQTVRQLLGQHRVLAIALISLVTLGLVGTVVLVTTPAGCSLARSLKSSRCVAKPVSVLISPAPTFTQPQPSPAFQPPPQTQAPYNPGSSSNPPNNPGASSYPPYNPGASGGDPFQSPASGSFPPLAFPASPGTSVQAMALSCRLPVYAGGPGSGGFIVFPGANFVADPRSAVTAPSPSPGSASPTPPQYGPGYVGWWGSTYDAKYSKWLPVPWAWVSPDGTRYAYPLGGDVYVQSVTGGAQLDLGEGQRFGVLDVENDGVYVTLPGQAGLWVLPFSGATKQITASGFWQAVSQGAAYGTSTSAVPQGATNTILKLDLVSGSTVPFFTWQGSQSAVVGFDAQGHPIIQVSYPNGVALFLATGPSSSTVIAANTYQQYVTNPPFPQPPPIADAHGLWFSIGQGVVLFANGQWYGMSNIGGQLAGQCT